MSAVLQPVHRLSVDDVRRMSQAGILTGEDRVELVHGILIDIAPPGGTHSAIVARLTEQLARAATDAWEVRVQDVLFVPAGFLSPDLVVVPRSPTDAEASEALLAIEVSHTTRRRDAEKAALYAEAGVPEYWRVDVEDREVVVHRAPGASGYGEVTRAGPTDALTPLLGAPTVDVAAVLGPAGRA